MKLQLSLIVPVIALALTGCASTKISNLDAYKKTDLQQAEKMPTASELSGAKSRVIVFAFEDKKWSGAGEDVSDKVIKELNTTQNVTIVDRTLAAQLGKEIELAETKGKTGYKGQDVADFAITGKITSGGAGVKFTEASSWVDKEGKSHYVPAKCTTSGKAAFTLKVVQLPALDVVKTIDVDADASAQEDARFSYCPELSKGAADGIVFEALSNAVQKAHTDLKNQFAPTGYVVERRIFEKNNIFKTTLGEGGGAKMDLPVIFARVVEEKNPLTGKTTIEKIQIAEGVISDQVGSSFSFVIVSEPEKAAKILMGDKVQVKYEDSFFDKYNKLMH